jgi:hypothetical protein
MALRRLRATSTPDPFSVIFMRRRSPVPTSANSLPVALVIARTLLAMRFTGYTWEDVGAAVGDLERQSLSNIYQEYRQKYLLPFAELAPMGREVVKLRGEMRLQWFETMREGWLQRPQRKIVVFPHGIYTITYKQDRRRPDRMVASLQKGRRVNGRIRTRQVYLGPAASVTKEALWAKSLELEKRLTVFLEQATGVDSVNTGNMGRINQSRQAMFGLI